MKKQLAVAALTLGLVLGMGSAAAQTQAQDSDVNVTVTNITTLDVRPTSLDYPGLEPGDLENVSSNNFAAVEISNIGSTDISEISASTTLPSDNPFSTGDASQYDSGNFIKIKTEKVTSQSQLGNIPSISNFHYVNRVEFVEDPVPSYVQLADDPSAAVSGTLSNGTADVGRFRTGNEWYHYVIYYDDGGTTAECDGTGASELWIGTEAHTPTSLGTYDFTDSSNANVSDNAISSVSDEDDYGVVDNVPLGGENYDIYTYCEGSDDGHTLRTRFNVNINKTGVGGLSGTVGERTAGTTQHILDVSSAGNSLRPGQSFPLDIGVEVPLGVAEGQVTEGTLTLQASTDGL